MKNPSLAAFNSHGKPLNLYRPVYFWASFPAKWATLGRRERASANLGSHLWYKCNNSKISTTAWKRNMLISYFVLALMPISLLLLLSHESESSLRAKMARLKSNQEPRKSVLVIGRRGSCGGVNSWWIKLKSDRYVKTPWHEDGIVARL